MHPFLRTATFAITVATLSLASLRADVLTIDASNPLAPNHHRIVMGSAKSPSGSEISIDGTCISLDGKPWLAVMGEFHFSRYPADEWRDELLKMKAGGISIVSCYVFWIHHEEVEGKFDWTGQRDLHRFVQLCGELGLRVVVRCGPWDHGEVRNGGFPDWLLAKGYKLRSNDAGYLQEVKTLYGEIAKQLQGQLWKDGGPVIGVQIENEFRGPPEHLLTLKKMLIDAGVDVPIYTRTGWPQLSRPIEFGQIVPLFGGYAEGFWDRALTTMPGDYWKEFIFQPVRTDTAVANEHFGQREAKDEADSERYPYLTCELGAGMMTSYHRRINVFAQDAISIAMVKLGSGSNLPGYYMYHGGTNPDSQTGITLQESQATKFTNYNDLPVKSYDFQTAVGEFGQIREQYHLLRRLHLFLNDFGSRMTQMPAIFPETKPSGKTDATTLRWSIRSDGKSGFIFANNYQRLQPMPAKPQSQFKIKLADSELLIPEKPIDIPADCTFLWPFNLDLGDGVRVIYATAQPICHIEDADAHYIFFTTTGVPAEFAFEPGTSVAAPNASMNASDDRVLIRHVTPSHATAIQITPKSGKPHRLILLSEDDSLHLWKGEFGERDRVVVTSGNVIFDHDKIRISTDVAESPIGFLPRVNVSSSDEFTASEDGVFQQLTFRSDSSAPRVVSPKQTRSADSPREIPIGPQRVAQAPTDFDHAAVWQIDLPKLDRSHRHLLRIRYAGDVARAYAGNRLLTDNFYNGASFDIGLDRFADALQSNPLTVKILPLQKDAPIYMLDQSRPDFEGQPAIAKLIDAKIVEQREIVLTAKE